MVFQTININEFLGSKSEFYNRKIPDLQLEVYPKNLSDFLKDVPEFQRVLFPFSRTAITTLNRRIKDFNYIGPSKETVSDQLYSRIAQAVDKGVILDNGQIEREIPDMFLQSHSEYGKTLYNLLNTYLDTAKTLTRCKATIGFLYIIGILDPIVRGFRPITDVKIFGSPRKIKLNEVKEWFESVISDSVYNEIVSLLNMTELMMINGDFYQNPIFGPYGPITGADGDWISGDTLVELKCTVANIKRQYIAQLICYYALSRFGRFNKIIPKINKLALCLPRQSTMLYGKVDDWLLLFGAPKSENTVSQIQSFLDSCIKK